MPSNGQHLRKFWFKPGQSGNPSGKPKGTISMKTWARNYLMSLPKEERADFLNDLDPGLVWRMAEGDPNQKLEGEQGKPLIQIVFDPSFKPKE